MGKAAYVGEEIMAEDKLIQIVIATHKKYRMPTDSMYLPLHVGAEGKKDENGNDLDLGYTKDNTGDHISEKNASFCELTALYWAWKNLDASYIGLAHYRRNFSCQKKSKDPFENVATYAEMSRFIPEYKVIVPHKQHYFIETLYSHYAHTHYAEHLDETRKIIEQLYPAYLESYDAVVSQRSGYMFNMMVMEKTLFQNYCKWLFDILFALEERMGVQELSPFQERFYGRVSEIIFNVWLEYQLRTGVICKKEIKEISCIYMEKIKYSKKVQSFLMAKLFHKKYQGSF